MLLTGVFVGFLLMNFLDLSNHIRNGALDLLIVKPISLQFSISFRQFQFAAAIPNIIVSVILFCLGLRGMSIIWYNALLYALLMICAVFLTYTIFLILQLSAFWVVKAEALSNIFETVWDNNNMPMQIYPKRIAAAFVYAIPLFVISNFPIIALTGNLVPSNLFWAIFISIALTVICRLFWNVSVKKYSSANS
jgi:ABC-2 type transport system permease protein